MLAFCEQRVLLPLSLLLGYADDVSVVMQMCYVHWVHWSACCCGVCWAQFSRSVSMYFMGGYSASLSLPLFASHIGRQPPQVRLQITAVYSYAQTPTHNTYKPLYTEFKARSQM